MLDLLLTLSRQALFTYRALLSWIAPSKYVIVKLLEPLAQLSFFAVLGTYAGREVEYYVVGNAVRAASLSGLFGSFAVIANERRGGTLQALVAAPLPLPLGLAARSILQGLDGLTSISVAFIFGWYAFGVDFGAVDWPYLILALATSSYSVGALGLILASVGLVSADVNVLMNVVYGGLLLLTGVNFPVSDLPWLLQSVASFLPLTHGVAAVRIAMTGDTSGVLSLVGREALLGIAYLGIGILALSALEAMARRRGTLDIV